jgi:hypothetical protein
MIIKANKRLSNHFGGDDMSPLTLEVEIADATKRFVGREWHLDVAAFKKTTDRAWVGLAGRILEKPGLVMPAKHRADTGVRIGDVK